MGASRRDPTHAERSALENVPLGRIALRIATLAPAPPRRRYAALAVVLVLAAAGLFAAGGPAPEPLVVRVDGGAAALAVSGGRVWAAAPRTSSIVVLDASSGEGAL